MKLHERIPLLINMMRLRWASPEKLNSATQKDVDVVVSFTSIPSRLGVAHHTVKSILVQSRPPKKLILWLHESARSQIPESLKEWCGDKFEIRFTPLDSPHCKLVPSLLAFPDKTIVTCDDDQYYSRNWLRALIDKSRQNPECIIGQRFRKIEFSESGELLPYKQWRYNRNINGRSDRFLALGVGGVLYPPGVLHADATDSDKYLECCPKADDLWFKAMALMNSADYVATSKMQPFYELMDSQEVNLRQDNIRMDGNSAQWLSICELYPELKKISSA